MLGLGGVGSDYILPERAVRRRWRWLMLVLAAPVAALALGLGSRPAPTRPIQTSEVFLIDQEFASPANALLEAEPYVGPTPSLSAAIEPPDLAPEVSDEALSGKVANHELVADLPEPEPEPEPSRWREITVRSGDSLSILFERNQLRGADWLALSKMDGSAKRLRRLHPGDTLRLELDESDALQTLQMRIDDTRTLVLSRSPSGFEQSVIHDEIERREEHTKGTITSSLFLAGQDAGLSDRLIMELAGIFAWDVDFALDIRGGDQFTVVYENLYRNGEFLKEGDILAAEFVTSGRTVRAVRYAENSGPADYYSPAGRPMRKAFLRTPVEFTRISSRFSLGRKHPILNRIRAHKGVDYAAARGTPIKAAGAGKVVHAGRKGGYGNVVIIQHGGKYQTLYAHLDQFRRGIRVGASVTQGQTIGYVGSTGLATGPHLHYEFRVNGAHVDPLSVTLPAADPIAKGKLPTFKASTAKLLARLDELNGTEVADAQ